MRIAARVRACSLFSYHQRGFGPLPEDFLRKIRLAIPDQESDVVNSDVELCSVDVDSKSNQDEQVFTLLNLKDLLADTEKIDLENEDEIEERIASALSPNERQRLMLTAEDEARILDLAKMPAVSGKLTVPCANERVLIHG